jgi:catechol 2,3-dioxygenase-like lactoylglutathione lyase family enzyme
MEEYMQENATKAAGLDGPPKFESFHHVSIPCRDLEEGIRFYTEVMGGRVRVKEPFFASIQVADAAIGIGAEGCSYVERSAEYPHFAFHAGGEEMLQMKDWLTRCGIPSTIFWTRMGVEALMFFRDPSGNLIEVYCEKGFKGADKLPRGPARGHGRTVNVDELYYDKWQTPASR